MKKLYWLSLTRDEQGNTTLCRNVTTYRKGQTALSSPYTHRPVTIEQANRITASMLDSKYRLGISFAPMGQFYLIGWAAEWTVTHD